MGIIISRFRKKKSTKDVLEDLDKRIRDMETQGVNAAQRCRRVTTNLVLYTVGLYVISVVIWYWYWPPLNVKQQLYRLPALIFTPILILLLRLGVKFYYTRKIRNNDKRLVDMRSKKKQIIEEVMDHETYKVARSILEKFAPESLGGKGAFSVALATAAQPQKNQQAFTPQVNSEIRRRPVPSPTVQSNQLPMTRASVNSPDNRPNMQVAKPFQPYDRTFLDRILEFFVGDGPSNRFALICKSCMCHNGMALKEEFEYLQFRCYYCQHWNPARKQRPQAPRLDESPSRSPLRKESSGVTASTNINKEGSSSSESEDDEKITPNESTEENKETTNETAELNPTEDDTKSEETSSSEHDSSYKQTGNDLAASQENKLVEETPETADSDEKNTEDSADNS